MKHCDHPESEDLRDHKFIKMKVVTMLILMAETWKEVDKMGMKGSMGKKKVMKKEMENSNVITCCFLHAKHVIIIQEDI